MITLLKIAWRNLWRNKRRSLITMASVFFAVILALVMRSMQLGTYQNMIKNAVSFYTGYIQIHKTGYWDDKSINNTFAYNSEVESEVLSDPNVSSITPRLESFALASTGNFTKGALMIGTDPVKEDNLTKLSNNIVEGKYLEANDRGVLVSINLAKYLNVGVGDSIIFLGQGYHGITAAGSFPVRGLLEFPTPELNKQTIYMSLPEAQYFYAAPDRLTSLALMISDPKTLKETVVDLHQKLGNDYEVMEWKEMMPDLLQEIQADNAGGIIMLGILYLIIGFGILGTIMMMTMERSKEFAVMIAVGMRKTKLIFMVLYETLILGLMGTIAGVVAGLPIILYLYYHPIRLTGKAAEAMAQFNTEPIIPFALDPGYFLNQSYVVIIMTLLAFLFPLFAIGRFNVIKGMRQ